jgi:hypothetical protein
MAAKPDDPAAVTGGTTVTDTGGDQSPGNEKPGKVYTYRCVKPCIIDGRYRRVGALVVLPRKSGDPHLEPVN